MRISIHLLITAILMFLSACGEASPAMETTQPPQVGSEGTGSGPDATTVTGGSQTAVVEPLPPEPQEITFMTSDGKELQGRYYPAAVNQAPLVVLMHWAGGDMNDWNEIAVWLQNRAVSNPYPNPGSQDWWDPTWFPVLPDDATYGVFDFSFRDCRPSPHGCQIWTPDDWLLDARAAMLKAVELEGVDPSRIISIGSSIGADGSIDGCTHLNEQLPGSCQGAASLSPGDYLNLSYAGELARLGAEQPPKPAWCLVPTEELGFCQQYMDENENLTIIEFQNAGHGNLMLQKTASPSALDAILDFLSLTVGK